MKTNDIKEKTMREAIELLYYIHKPTTANEIHEATGYPISYIKSCLEEIKNKKELVMIGE